MMVASTSAAGHAYDNGGRGRWLGSKRNAESSW
jgi:hypothetical protein